LRFLEEDRALPVLWHQSLLVFVQRYKTTISVEQKEALRPLLKKHFHPIMTEEIRRELYNSHSRGEGSSNMMM
jgi:essential nuclear protein 1